MLEEGPTGAVDVPTHIDALFRIERLEKKVERLDGKLAAIQAT